MKKLTTLIFTIFLTLAFITGALASTTSINKAVFKVGSSKYIINDTEYSMDAVPFIQNGRTYVPVRYLAYSCGLMDNGIKWYDETKTVTLNLNSDKVVSLKLKVGDPTLLISSSTGTDGVKNETKQMDVAPLIKDSRIYLPARYVTEAFGFEIVFDENSQSVLIFPNGLPGQLSSYKVQINEDTVNIRNGPGTNHPVVDVASRGDNFFLADKSADWYKILLNNNTTGWVSSRLVVLEKNSGDDIVHLSALKSIYAQVENNTTVITIQSEKDPLNYKISSLYNPDRLVIDLAGIAPGQVPQTIEISSPLAEGIRVGWYSKNPDITRVVVDLKDKVRYDNISSDNSKQLRIVLRERSNSLLGAIIALDPGHGGSDPGAIGSSGLQEKDVNLAIAQKTAEYLRKQGATVILTRTNDIFVGLTERPNVADQNGSDLFLSIHCNSFSNDVANGTSTYHLRSQIEGMDTVRNKGISLANYIQSALVKTLNRSNRGVQQADFAVLTRSKVPAALVEIAFISNPEEERLLGDTTFQDLTAQALTQGISEYLANQ